MSSTTRREQILEVMRTMRESALSQSDFTASKVAQVAGVSTVWLYRLAGAEFREIRSHLEGPRRPAGTVISELKDEITRLRRQARELRARLKTAIREELSEAIRLIEQLDAENRMLRAEVRMLRTRLAECQVVTALAYHQSAE